MPVPRYEPMLATRAEPGRGEWVAEPKLDGWRCLVTVDGGVRVRTRSGRDVTSNVPELAGLAEQVPDGTVLDGELVAGQGRAPDFTQIAGQMARRHRTRALTFAAFDVLHLDDHSTIELPYRDRRQLLVLAELDGPAWCTVPTFDPDTDLLLKVCTDHQLEGLVLKRLDSPYLPGRRSRTWLKVKTATWLAEHAPARHERIRR